MQTEVSSPRRIRRVFITGASGYVGRNLVRHLRGHGVSVVGLARSAEAAAEIQAAGGEAFVGDLLATSLAAGMTGCDALVHAAADTSHGLGSDAQRRINEDGTRNVFACARASGVAAAVHISTESVLLDGRPLINATEVLPFPKHPSGVYSASKAAAERIALSQARPPLAVMAVRPRFVWGRDDTTALPHLRAAAESGQFAWIDGGNYLTSTTHIDNLCAGVMLALTRGRTGQVYFITDGEPVVFRDFITRLLETQGLAAPEAAVPRWLLYAVAVAGDTLGRLSGGRIQGPLTLQTYATSAVEVTLDITRARRELGYAPVIGIDAGMAELRARAGAGAARAA